MENNVLEFHATQVPHSTVNVDVAKHLFLLAQQVHIGMVTDVFTSLTSVQQVWFGRTTVVKAILQSVQVTHMNLTVNVFHFPLSAHQA